MRHFPTGTIGIKRNEHTTKYCHASFSVCLHFHCDIMKRTILAALAVASTDSFPLPNRSTKTTLVPLCAMQDSQSLVDGSESRSDQLFAKFPLFEGILHENKDLISKLGSELETLEVSSNEVVIDFGDPWEGAYFLIEGALECVGPVDEEKSFLPGDSFGEVALLCDTKVSVVRVKGLATRSTLFRLRGDVFDRLVDDGTFTVLLMKYLTSKLTSSSTPSMALTALATRILAAGLAQVSSGGSDNIFALSSSSSLDPRLYLDDGLNMQAGSVLNDTLHSLSGIASGPSADRSIQAAMALVVANTLKGKISQK